MKTERETTHMERIRKLNGAVSVSAAAWLTEHYVNLHALGDSPIDPIREEFMAYLSERIGAPLTYSDTEQCRSNNGLVFNGIIYSFAQERGTSHRVEDAEFVLGTLNSIPGNWSQIFGLTNEYGRKNTTCTVFPIENLSERATHDHTLRLEMELKDYRVKFSGGWKELYANNRAS
jgi:hypothetical protein